MAEIVVICKCGQWNRLGDHGGRSGYFSCGQCGNRLTLPKQSAGAKYRKWILVLAGVCIAGSLAALPYISSTNVNPVSVAQKPSAADKPAPAPVSTRPPVQPAPREAPTIPRFDPAPLPPVQSVELPRPLAPAAVVAAPKADLIPVPIATGLIRSRKGNAIAPLKIESGEGGTNYAIKLVHAQSGAEQMLIYLEGGRTFDTKMPLGPYKIKVAAGQRWYGDKLLFGSDTSYFQLRRKHPTSNEEIETFVFSRSSNQLSGHRISLKSVIAGNLEQQAISANEFQRAQ